MIAASLSLIIGGVALMWVGDRSRNDRLARNGVVGLRTKTSMASDEAWYAAQRAGAALTAMAGLAGVIGGALSLFFTDHDAVAAAIVLGTAGVVLTIVVVAGMRGQRAAREALDS